MRPSMPRRSALGIPTIALFAASCAFVPPASVDLHSIKLSGEYGPSTRPSPSGTLRVVTRTHDFAYGTHATYSLHEGYDIYDEHGTLLERVDNHRTPTDEEVTDVRLAAGTYFVAVPDGPRPEFWIEVKIQDGQLTEADVTKPPSGATTRS